MRVRPTVLLCGEMPGMVATGRQEFEHVMQSWDRAGWSVYDTSEGGCLPRAIRGGFDALVLLRDHETYTGIDQYKQAAKHNGTHVFDVDQLMNADEFMEELAVDDDGPPVLDSGQREDFPTGACRDRRTGKGRYDLISPHALKRLAILMEKGAEKYGDRNWEKGMPASRFMDSALRHLNMALMGCKDEDHLAAAAFNVLAMMHFEVVGPIDLLDLNRQQTVDCPGDTVLTRYPLPVSPRIPGNIVASKEISDG